VGSIPITRSNPSHKEPVLNKLLKIIAIAAAAVIVLIVVAVIALTIFVDPNRYRGDIIEAVKRQTGRDLKIEGKLSLSFFPWIGLETKRLELSNATGFGKEPFAVVASSATKVELLPLLRRRIVVDAVRLNGLKLHLARNAKGITNWDDLTRQGGGKPAPKPAPEHGGGAEAALAAFTINTFQVRDSEFTWHDATANAQYAVRGLDLTSGNLLGTKPAPLKLAFDLESQSPPIKERVQLDSRLNFDPAKETLDVPELSLSLGDLRLQAKLSGSRVLSAPKFSGSIDIAAFDARALLEHLGVDYKPAGSDALRKVALTTKLRYDAKRAALSDLRLTLDRTKLTGNLAVQTHSAPAYRFNFALDDIDVDRYLPTAEKPAGNKPAANSKAEPVVIPLALLRETDAKGALHIGKLKAIGIRSEDVTVKVSAKNGHIVLGPNAAKLYAGTYVGRTLVDASGRVPHFRFEEKLAGIQLGPLLKDADVFDKYSGTGNVSLELTARGLDANAVKRTLNGTAAVSLRDGKIEGVDLQKIVQQAQALLKKARGREVEGAPAASDETTFKSLSATARVTNGVVRNDDFKLEGPVIRAQGAGTANLVQESLDYRLQVTLAEGTGHKGTTVPVRISGPFAGLKYRVDISSLVKEQAKPVEQKLEKKLEQKKEDLREKLRDRLLDKLRR
jgi:AsmA protein